MTADYSAAGCLIGTRRFGRSDVVTQSDRLSCGPLAGLAPLEEWRQLRYAYWNEICPLPPSRDGDQSEGAPLIGRPEVLLSAEVVNVWLGIDLDNQLFLAWFLELAQQIGLALQRIRVVQFERHPTTGEAVMSVGQLTPEEVIAHPPPASLSGAAVADLRAAWAAITASEPTSLLHYIETHAESSSVFDRAFAKILDRFPDRDNGLNRWGFEILRHVPKMGINGSALLEAAYGAREGVLDNSGSLYLHDRLRRLSSPTIPWPLLERSGSTDLLSSNFAVSRAGRSVLEGQANAVDLNGIDDWVGGMHLQSTADRVWFHWRDSLVARERSEPGLPG